MTLRRFLPLLALIALLVAPFGRMAAAEAMARQHHGAAAVAGHCDTMPSPDQDRSERMDCMVACAVVMPAAASAPHAEPSVRSTPVRFAIADFPGRHPEADPPPPRFS